MAGPAMAITSAPRAAPSDTSRLPVTPPAPLTSSVSPCATWSASSIACAAVRAGTGNAAAASHDTLSGLRASSAEGAACGAHAPCWRSGSGWVRTSSPAEKPSTASHRRDHAGGFDAQRHRRLNADVPLAPADDVVPVGDTGGPDFDEDLVAGGRRRIGHVDQPDRAAHRLDAGYAHSRPTTCRSAARRGRG